MKRLVCVESSMRATLFLLTFTSVENKWEDLLCSLCEFVKEDHVICSNIMIVKQCFHKLSKYNHYLFGKIVYYVAITKFQNQGNQHGHGLL
jgi:hypothetical protein